MFADEILKFNENCRKLSKRVENTVGKGEIARYEQFLLFSQCFQKTYTADTQKPGLVWEMVKQYWLPVTKEINSFKKKKKSSNDKRYRVIPLYVLVLRHLCRQRESYNILRKKFLKSCEVKSAKCIPL